VVRLSYRRRTALCLGSQPGLLRVSVSVNGIPPDSLGVSTTNRFSHARHHVPGSRSTAPARRYHRQASNPRSVPHRLGNQPIQTILFLQLISAPDIPPFISNFTVVIAPTSAQLSSLPQTACALLNTSSTGLIVSNDLDTRHRVLEITMAH